MRPSITKNRTTDSGYQYGITEMGDILFFGGNIQRYYTIDNMKNERPFSGDIDLFQLQKDTGILPIVLTENELPTLLAI
jgi:hypothetical protein